jgi:acyl-CoA synthetase
MVAAFDRDTIDAYRAAGAWDADTVADLVARQAVHRPDGTAFIAPDATLTWSDYRRLATRLAGGYATLGLRPGDLVAVLLTGGALVHVAYLAAQQAGLVVVGLAPRASDTEIAHLLRLTGARTLVTRPLHRGRPADQLAAAVRARDSLDRHLIVDLPPATTAPATTTAPPGAVVDVALSVDGVGVPLLESGPAADLLAGRGLGADDLFFLNSTSGTTGLPKCVRQTMNMRKYFAGLAADAAGFGPDEVFASVVPAPYGFGQWTAHFTPAIYGFPTVLVEEFDAAGTLRLIEAHRVTVLAAVTSQFIMMLNSPEMARRDLSSLRVMFTGGERVPSHRAAEFEDRTGCAVLQFYGSNEAGPISVTRRRDDRAHRLGTAGKVIAGQQVRLFGPGGEEVTATGGPGQCAALGPGISPGYFGDEAADRQLFRPDGWLLTGDLVTIDPDGYLAITGRAADFIIRGGYNISALVVEEAVGSHPRVAQVAVVGVPDEVLGERVGAFVSTVDGDELTLAELCAYLAERDVSKQSWPERLATVDALPLGTGGKVDKVRLRAEAAGRF